VGLSGRKSKKFACVGCPAGTLAGQDRRDRRDAAFRQTPARQPHLTGLYNMYVV